MVDTSINHATLSNSGFSGGTTGTATSIGCRSYALLYQHWPAQQIRTTMAVYFLIGAGLSLTALVLAYDLTWAQLRAELELSTAMLAGVVAGAPSRRGLPGHLVRPEPLAVSAASAVVLDVRSVVV